MTQINSDQLKPGMKVRISNMRENLVHRGCTGTISKISDCGYFAVVKDINYDEERPSIIFQNQHAESKFINQKRRGWARFSIYRLIPI